MLFSSKHLVPMEEVTSQLEDNKMKPDVGQHLKLKKDLWLDFKGITRFVILRLELLYLTHQFINGKRAHITGLLGELIFSNLQIVKSKFGIKEKPITCAQKD